MGKSKYQLLLIAFLFMSKFAYAESYYGPTVKHDRIYQIALALRPAKSATVGQTMAAIYELNHGAFDDDNINKLHKGSMLLIPTAEQVTKISPAAALDLVNQHHANWKKQNPTETLKVEATDNQAPALTKQMVSLPEQELQEYISAKIDIAVNKRIRAIGKTYSTKMTPMTSDAYDSLDYTAIPAEIDLSSIPKINFDKVHEYSHAVSSNVIASSNITDLKNQLNQLQVQLSSVINILHENTDVFTSKKMTLENKFSELNGYAISSYLGKNFNLNPTEVINPRLEIGIAIFLGILLFGVFLESRGARRAKTNEYLSEEIIENPNDEYDFMGSEEGIPAKMNLARAYFDMGLPDKARKVLTEIAVRGDSSQKEEARSMLLDLDR